MATHEVEITHKYKLLIKAIADFAIEKNPALAKPENKAALNSIVTNALKLVFKSGKEEGLTERKLDDYSVMKNLAESVAASATMSASLSESPELNKKLESVLDIVRDELKNNPEFKKKFDAVAKLEGPEQSKALDKLLKEHFKDDPKKLQLLQRGLKEIETAVLKNSYEKLNSAEKAPEPQIPGNDPYSNLTGMILSGQTGGLQIPIAQYIGNGLGFNDWNPNNGSSPLDAQNSIEDSQFGDSLGLNATTMRNYLSIPETAIDSFSSALESAGLRAPSTAPSMKPPGF